MITTAFFGALSPSHSAAVDWIPLGFLFLSLSLCVGSIAGLEDKLATTRSSNVQGDDL